MLTDEAPPIKTVTGLAQADAPPPPTPQDEALRASLPFAPAIAMDPVDGSKISIRASIPTVEYKNKLYYFANEDHKRTFVANPEQYTKGLFAFVICGRWRAVRHRFRRPPTRRRATPRISATLAPFPAASGPVAQVDRAAVS